MKYHAALRKHPRDAFLSIRYEHLVQNMVETLGLVCAYADLACTEDVMTRMLPTRVNSSPIRDYREQLTAGELDLLDKLLAEPLTETGYGQHDVFGS